MKKWKNPELKVLGVESTYEGISTFGIQAGQGYVWVCAECGRDQRNDINEIDTIIEAGETYYTPNQNCGVCKVSHRWKKELVGFVPPSMS